MKNKSNPTIAQQLSRSNYRVATIAQQISFLGALLLLAAPLSAQTDSTATIDRSVTVEREYQPTVKAAGKLTTRPQIFSPDLQPVTVNYSDFARPMATEKNVNPLGYADTDFSSRETLYNGFVRGGFGHTSTLLDFSYRVDAKTFNHYNRKGKLRNEGFLDIYMGHHGMWGRKALEETTLGLTYNHLFKNAHLYFGAEGGNQWFTHYYKYLNEDGKFLNDVGEKIHLKQFEPADKQSFWTANALVGVQNTPGAEVLYQVQTGYEGFFAPGLIGEHAIHSKAMFEWATKAHHVGIESDVRNRFYMVPELVEAPSSKHAIHIQPYYAYEGKRVRLHAGANLDLGLGGYSRVFGASPNVELEVDITKDWLSFFLEAEGELTAEGIGEELTENRFLHIPSLQMAMADSCCGVYKPVDAVLGLRFRPHPALLFDVHGGYEYAFNEHIYVYNEPLKQFCHFEQDQMMARVGATLHYHYQDIFSMNIEGDYFFHYGRELEMPSTDYSSPLRGGWEGSLTDFTQGGWAQGSPDKPLWRIHARFDGRIDKKWSLYSDNYFVGTREALVLTATNNPHAPLAIEEKSLKPYFDLNLGAQYNYNERLSFFIQLNNYLAWTQKLTGDLLYGTPAQGVNFLLGASYRF